MCEQEEVLEGGTIDSSCVEKARTSSIEVSFTIPVFEGATLRTSQKKAEINILVNRFTELNDFDEQVKTKLLENSIQVADEYFMFYRAMPTGKKTPLPKNKNALVLVLSERVITETPLHASMQNVPAKEDKLGILTAKVVLGTGLPAQLMK